jgi:hypothetical protein
MNVGQLGNRVAQRIIDLPRGTVTAMDVGDGDTAEMRRGGRRKRFDSVADDKNEVCFEFGQGLGNRCRRLASAHRHRHSIAAGVDGPGNDAVDVPPILPNRSQAFAVGGVKMHSGGQELKPESRMPLDRGQNAAH